MVWRDGEVEGWSGGGMVRWRDCEGKMDVVER